MKHHDISSARRAIASLARNKNLRRYSPDLRARLTALVDAHPELGVWSLAKALDMAPQTLAGIAGRRSSSLLPVRVVGEQQERSVLRVRGPRGIVVEGLDVGDVAELIRSLS